MFKTFINTLVFVVFLAFSLTACSTPSDSPVPVMDSTRCTPTPEPGKLACEFPNVVKTEPISNLQKIQWFREGSPSDSVVVLGLNDKSTLPQSILNQLYGLVVEPNNSIVGIVCSFSNLADLTSDSNLTFSVPIDSAVNYVHQTAYLSVYQNETETYLNELGLKSQKLGMVFVNSNHFWSMFTLKNQQQTMKGTVAGLIEDKDGTLFAILVSADAVDEKSMQLLDTDTLKYFSSLASIPSVGAYEPIKRNQEIIPMVGTKSALSTSNIVSNWPISQANFKSPPANLDSDRFRCFVSIKSNATISYGVFEATNISGIVTGNSSVWAADGSGWIASMADVSWLDTDDNLRNIESVIVSYVDCSTLPTPPAVSVIAP